MPLYDQEKYDILQNRIDDFKKFLDSIARFLGWDNQQTI